MNYVNRLVCPACRSNLDSKINLLSCANCLVDYRIDSGIPRFVSSQGYTESFGLQWARFSKTQLDSTQQTNRSLDRFVNETHWQEEELIGKIVIDAGCGAGRFGEIVEKFKGHLIAVDYSNAIDVASTNLQSDQSLFIQADLTTLPFEDCFADYVYCIGVLQHTRAPKFIVEELLRILKVEGELTLTFYEDSSWHVRLYSKYLIRPITKRISKKVLLIALEKTSILWFPITHRLFSLPYPLNRVFRFVIPIANYVEYEYPDRKSAIDEAILDTFDMLSPEYDKPIKRKHLQDWISNSGFEVVFLDDNKMKGTVRVRKVS